jgi:hypothetical protein
MSSTRINKSFCALPVSKRNSPKRQKAETEAKATQMQASEAAFYAAAKARIEITGMLKKLVLVVGIAVDGAVVVVLAACVVDDDEHATDTAARQPTATGSLGFSVAWALPPDLA